MKTVITFLAFILFSVSVSAQRYPSRLVVTNLENSTLRVVIDGRQYNGIGKTLALTDLSAGYHQVKVYEVRRGWFKGDRLMYSSNVFLKPNYQVNVLINRSGQLSMAEQQIGRSYGRGNDRRYGRDYDRNYGRDYDRNYGRDNDRNRYGNGRY